MTLLLILGILLLVFGLVSYRSTHGLGGVLAAIGAVLVVVALLRL